MTRPIPNYLFHIPNTGKVIDYATLEKKMHGHKRPETVHVIEAPTHKPLGSFPAMAALLKFR